MFEEFKTSSYEDWVTKANQETSRIDSINFPFTFNLDGLSLSAINSENQLSDHPKTPYKSKHSRPIISVCQQENAPGTDWQQLGAEDILLDFADYELHLGQDKLQQLKGLGSIGVFYQSDDVGQVADFGGLEKDTYSTRISFYPSILPHPIGKGGLRLPDCEGLAEIINQSSGAASVKYLGIRGDEFMNHGINVSQELAITLSLITYYWDKLTDLGLGQELLLDHTEVALGLSGEFYIDIVKIRAARTLLHSLIGAFEISQIDVKEIKIRAVSGLLNKTLYDPDENLLRITTEALAATLGGAEIITLRTHDLHYQDTSDFGRRMAANVQNLIRYESHLHRVVNPVDGSYFLEDATNQLVDSAWRTFLEIEKEGGIESYFNSKGKALVSDGRNQRKQQFLKQNKKRVGVTRYVNGEEKIDQSVVNSSFQHFSLTNQWEEIRLKFNQLVSQSISQAKIIVPITGKNSIISARITFVSDILNSLGVIHQVVNSSKATNERFSDSDFFIICADDEWYLNQAADFLSSNRIAEEPVFAVGSLSELSRLVENKLLSGVLGPTSDLNPLLETVQKTTSHET